MRKISGPNPGDVRQYKPDVEIDGWRNLDDDEPIIVHIKQPTEQDKRKISNMMLSGGKFEYDSEGGKGVFIPSDTMNDDHHKYAIENFVVNIENYLKPNGDKIKNGKDLWIYGEQEIIFNIVNEITKSTSLSEEEKKSSEGHQGSLQQEKQSIGTVMNAEKTSSTLREIAAVEYRDSSTSTN